MDNVRMREADDLIETTARAIYAEHALPCECDQGWQGAWDRLPNRQKEAWRRSARAALESIRSVRRVEGSAVPLPEMKGERLTPRERLILASLGRQRSIREIAAENFISPNTVKTHVKNIYRKLGIQTRAEAASAAHIFDVALVLAGFNARVPQSAHPHEPGPSPVPASPSLSCSRSADVTH